MREEDLNLKKRKQENKNNIKTFKQIKIKYINSLNIILKLFYLNKKHILIN